MDLKALREKSNKMLAAFIDAIGLDGEFYASTCNCPIEWKDLLDIPGEYITPGTDEFKKIIKSPKYDEKTKKILRSKGLILINPNYDETENLFITIMHETLHANRNLLIYDAVRNGNSNYAYNYRNGKFDQNRSKYKSSFADASQDILKGSIDTSKNTILSYKHKSFKKIEDMDFEEGKKDAQQKIQIDADEALVELMANLAFNIYTNKENGKSTDIWDALEEIRNDLTIKPDVRIMSKIISKHHDLELFNWMVDPIAYSNGDIHYDFFGRYTKDDQELLQELSNASISNMDFFLEALEASKPKKEIDKSDIKQVATSQTASRELSASLQAILNGLSARNHAQDRGSNPKKNTNEIE